MAKRPSHSLSLLAEVVEEYIKLECARRRNQMSIRRRSSLLEQYNVRVSTSRLQERQAQTRHHEFLVRKDNKSALDMIVDRVRELAELYSSTCGGGASPFSPMEKARLLVWAGDVEKVLYEFEPSENHNLDPIMRTLEKLQFLQDGHVCLAEVAVDARTLLEKWERDGIFDTSDNDDDDDAIREEDEGCYGATEERRLSRPTSNSYAYDTIRQRAAANLIKRNVLRWVRSQESFRDRVEEIQLFGKTTHSLMKELTNTASMRRPTVVSASNDIFDLVKVKRDGMYAHSIGFMDLMHFSKYVALFPVDQAIRTVEELEMKRFLFENRCALKLQTIWRKARKELQARRMRKLVEELKLQREKQAQEEREQERERLLLLSASKTSTPDMGDDKRRSVLASSKKNRTASVATPPSTASSPLSSSRMSSRGDDLAHDSQPSTPQSARLRGSAAGMGTKRKESKSRTAGSNDSKKRFSNVKSMNAREHSRFDDDDGDTKDVETAWQSFLDSATGLEDDVSLIPMMELTSDQMPGTGDFNQQQPGGIAKVVMPPSFDGDWKNWSDGDEGGALRETDDDDEADMKAEEKIACRLSSAAGIALPVTPASELITEDQDDTFRPKIRVKNSNQDTSSSRRPSEAPILVNQSVEPMSPPPSTSSYAFQLEDDADRFRIKKTRVGRLSVMAPFAEREIPQNQNQSQPDVPEKEAKRAKLPKATRKKKHLHDLEFGPIAKSNLALLQLVNPLVSTGDGESDDEGSGGDDDSDVNNEPIQQGRSGKPTAYVRRKGSTRKRRVDIIKHSIAVRETAENITYRVVRNQQRVKGEMEKSGKQAEPSEKTRTSPGEEPGGQFTYPIQKLDIRKEVVMRRASQHQNTEPASTLDQPITSGQQSNNRRMIAKKFGTHAEWLRSMGLEQTILKSPHPPPSRLKTSQRPGESQKSGSMQGDGTMAPGDSNSRDHTRPMRKKRLKRFLPTLDWQTADRNEAKPDDETLNSECESKNDVSSKPENSSAYESRGIRRNKSNVTESSAVASRESVVLLSSSSRNVGGVSAQDPSEPSEPSGSESSGELSNEDSSDAASESESNEEETRERNEMRNVKRDKVPRDEGSRSEREEEASDEEEVSGDEDGDWVEDTTTSGPDQVGLSGTPRARVRFLDEKERRPPPDSSQFSAEIGKKQIKKRHLELRDGGFAQDGQGSFDPSSELHEGDKDGGNLSSLSIKSSNIHHGVSHGILSRRTKSNARGAARSHRIFGPEEYAEDEYREPEEGLDAAAAVAMAKRQERKSSARHAAFQRLMMQYLGLLQCSPHEAILPPGSGS